MKTIKAPHCQACGDTDIPFEALAANDGYTPCCNEREVSPTSLGYGWDGKKVPAECDPDECYHD